MFSTVIGDRDKITIRSLKGNPGIIPLKLGNAKLTEYTHTLIHYYDLNPILIEINKLHFKSENITNSLITHKEYFAESSNYLKILNLTQDRVENKIKEILPHPQRTRRGLVNIVGSIFKAITGNLDASDGEHYEKIIQILEQNQNKLAGNIRNQNSISTSVINKFNSTVQQIGQNEKLIENKINQISLIVQKTTYRENSHFIKDLLNQIINLYEIINSILQDIENSITFARLKIMHPSIITLNDLFNELKKLEKLVGSNLLPLPINLEHMFSFEKIIDIDCFILNNKITYLLRVPISKPSDFEYFHLYSVPTIHQSLFKVVIPRDKYLIKNQLHYSYRGTPCKEVVPSLFICEEEDLQEIEMGSPCEVQLLQSTKNTSTCQQIDVTITQPVINQLDKTNSWLLILPTDKIVELKCPVQDERRKLCGTFLVNIPIECRFKFDEISITHNQQIIDSGKQPILFPDLEYTPPQFPLLNLSFHLHKIKLDELHELRNKIEENEPHIFNEVSTVPSLWTIMVYIVLIAIGVYLLCTYMVRKGWLRKKTTPTDVSSLRIELPPTRVS